MNTEQARTILLALGVPADKEAVAAAMTVMLELLTAELPAAEILNERMTAALALHVDDGAGECYSCETDFPCETRRRLLGQS